MSIVSSDEVCRELGIDYADDTITTRVNEIAAEADSYLASAIGPEITAFCGEDAVVAKSMRRLALMYIADIYDSRGVAAGSKLSNAAEARQHTLMQQCRLAYEMWADEKAGEHADA